VIEASNLTKSLSASTGPLVLVTWVVVMALAGAAVLVTRRDA
jgi:hypothetical protein